MNTAILDDSGEWNYPEALDFHIPEYPDPVPLRDDDVLRHRQLVSWCLIQRYRYYVLSDPKVTDREYDAIEQHIKDMESEAAYLKNKYSPTKTVGSCHRSHYPYSIRSLFPVEKFPINRKN